MKQATKDVEGLKLSQMKEAGECLARKIAAIKTIHKEAGAFFIKGNFLDAASRYEDVSHRLKSLPVASSGPESRWRAARMKEISNMCSCVESHLPREEILSLREKLYARKAQTMEVATSIPISNAIEKREQLREECSQIRIKLQRKKAKRRLPSTEKPSTAPQNGSSEDTSLSHAVLLHRLPAVKRGGSLPPREQEGSTNIRNSHTTGDKSSEEDTFKVKQATGLSLQAIKLIELEWNRQKVDEPQERKQKVMELSNFPTAANKHDMTISDDVYTVPWRDELFMESNMDVHSVKPVSLDTTTGRKMRCFLRLKPKKYQMKLEQNGKKSKDQSRLCKQRPESKLTLKTDDCISQPLIRTKFSVFEAKHIDMLLNCYTVKREHTC